MKNIFIILPICFNVFSSNNTAIKLESSDTKINEAINLVSASTLHNNNEDLEDDLKNNLISFYEDNNYVSPLMLNRLKTYLKANDKGYKFEQNISLNNASSRLSLSYEDALVSDNNFNNLKPQNINYNNYDVYYESSINNSAFIGINLDVETCKLIFNFIYDVCDNYDFGKELLSTLKLCIGISLSSFVIKTELEFNKIISFLLMLIPPDGIGSTIKLIIRIVGISIGLFLAIVTFFALMDKGFYIGFIAEGLLIWNWKFVCGIYE